jgi:hypothetical protein
MSVVLSEKPLVYLVFGIPNSGRRGIIFDLIEGGMSPDTQVLYFRPASEETVPFDEQIEALENVSTVDWQLDGAKVKHGRVSAAPEKVIFLASGTADPADTAEALKAWISHNDCRLGRIITVVHCSFLQEQLKSQGWYDACIHFSDIVLLGRREAVDNKWIKAFETRFKKQCLPCHIELVTKEKTKNPVAVLEPEARRASLFFDELIPIEEDEFEDEEQPEDIKPDRYIERNESGQRIRPIIEISRFL